MNNISVSDQMLVMYVFVDDYLKRHPIVAAWRKSPNSKPSFTDAEVITIGLMQSVFGCQTLKKTHLLVSSSFRQAFPKLCGYKEWLRRLNGLTDIVGRLLTQAALGDGPNLYLIDGKPIPLCKPIRHCRARLLHEDGAHFGKGSTGWYYGFKLHTLVHIDGLIVCTLLAPANMPERDFVRPLLEAVDGGTVLGDCGYRSKVLENEAYDEYGVTIITPLTVPDKKAVICSVRARVESVFAQLWTRFVDRTFSRSFTGLWNAIKLKMLHYNLTKAGIVPA